MRKIVIAAVGIAIFAAGVVAGGAATLQFTTMMYGGFNTVSAAAAVSAKVAALDAIRSNDYAKATEMLETLLDGDIISLKALMTDFPDPMAPKALARAAKYRAANPRKTGEAIVDNAVAEALASAPSGAQ
ncbi:hypothetical protein [Usitatibacter palustris]|uniref:hypothetical protein n=1 Tax=Usitatibacter palustris TaxID=2732487 RepID=UPI001489351D|nr:hypothetical protein [Usitatibacter palustris]